MPDDVDLTHEAAEGNTAAFSTLVQQHLNDVYNFLLRYTGSRDDAEDATQEAFVKAWRNIRRYDPEKPFRPWLFRIAKNAATDILRKRRGIIFSALADENFEEKVEDPEPLPDELFARAELATLVERALLELPEHDRLVVTLRYMEDFSFEEIADILGAKSTTVRSVHHRALKKLRDFLVP